MKLLKFSAKNYLSFEEEVHLDLHDLNILIGANGSGKSAILSCIELFLEKNNSIDVSKVNESNREAGNNNINLTGTFKIESLKAQEFFQKIGISEDYVEILKIYESGFSSGYLIRKHGDKDELLNTEESMTKNQLVEIASKYSISKNGVKSEIIENLHLFAEKFDDDGYYYYGIKYHEIEQFLPNIILFSSEKSLDPLNEIQRLVKQSVNNYVEKDQTWKKTRDTLVNEVKKVSMKEIKKIKVSLQKYNPELDDIQIEPQLDIIKGLDLSYLRISKSTGNPIEFMNESTGKRKQIMLGLFEYTTLMLEKSQKSNIIMFDEPDLHMDYNQIFTLLNIFKKLGENPQNSVIVATHSLKLIESVSPYQIFHFEEKNQSTKINIIMKEEYELFENFFKRISKTIGFNAAYLFFEKIFVLVEGVTEMNAFPILYEKINGITHVEHGIRFINASDCQQVIQFATYLKKSHKKVIAVVDKDIHENKHYHLKDLVKSGFREDDDLFILGQKKEFEDEFSSEQWTCMLNQYFPKSKSLLWKNEEIEKCFQKKNHLKL